MIDVKSQIYLEPYFYLTSTLAFLSVIVMAVISILNHIKLAFLSVIVMAVISILKHIKLAQNACISKFIPLLINLAYDRFTFIAFLWCSYYNIKDNCQF